ncbi:MAG: hypothetical protein U0176_21965 [Bacteroidia bacterium]
MLARRQQVFPVFTSTASNPTFGPFATAGTYLVKFQVTEQCCGPSIPAFRISRWSPPRAPPMQAPTKSSCGSSTTLAASPPTSVPVLEHYFGAGGTVTTSNSPTPTFNGTAGTTYTLRWTGHQFHVQAPPPMM